MKQITAILLLPVLIFFACSGNKTSEDNAEIKSDTAISYVDQIPAGGKKMLIKSAIIHMKSSTFGMTQNIVMYMDDYGKKQMTEVSQKLLGQEVLQRSVSDSVYMYTYSPKDKTGKKIKKESGGPDNINFTAITRKMARELNLKKTGTTVVAGHSCEVYTLEVPAANLKGTYYIWKGIPIKTVSSVRGISITMEATRIEENPAIPAETFKIPEDISFEEAASFK
ncbi:MAG TPA: hypothetical protein PLB59_02560 [Bacteroidales bacterium]|nr:hypothetical protein [Bacteroidales bacterium]HPI30228.1 hypothetical protein [Bacteroidales bacterium]HQN15533.1 hypothetical protein [Bacteroidales bacterium]HQP14825.1 hypothetical protein [Bacteroidales bacterium]